MGTEDRGPAAGLRELTELLVDTDDVEQALQHLSDTAARAVPGRPGASVSLRLRSGLTTVGASGQLPRGGDLVQYETGLGPCLEALSEQRRVVMEDSAAETRWGPFAAYALRHGVRSVASYPLGVPEGVPGGLNLYFTEPGGVPEGGEPIAALMADHGAVLLRAVLRHRDHVRMTAQLREALASRAVIDQAIGVLMVQRRIPADQAFALLQRVSQRRNRKLRAVAAGVVEAASGHPARPGEFRTDGPH